MRDSYLFGRGPHHRVGPIWARFALTLVDKSAADLKSVSWLTK